MDTFWDERYDREEYVYGREPNEFFASEISKIIPGKILLPGEGEGRNAIYAASLGWSVDAFDQSRIGFEKALLLAKENGVNINYKVCGVEEFPFPGDHYDVVGLSYFHAPPPLRKKLHQQVQNTLKPGGILILEAFHTSQLGNNTGGPQSPEMLFDKETLNMDFKGLQTLTIDELSVALNEGPFHRGEAKVIRFLGKKTD